MKTFFPILLTCFLGISTTCQGQQILSPQPYTPANFPESTASSTDMKVINIPEDNTQVAYLHDVPYIIRDGLELTLQIIAPKSESGSFPCIVYVQGSGWAKQDVYRNLPPLAEFAKRGYVIAIVEYRPSNVAKFPAQLQDSKTAIRFMRKNAAKYHVDTDNIFVWGDSSGGHTSLMIGLTQGHPELDTHELNEYSIKVNAVVDFYGPTDITQMNLEPSILDHISPQSFEGQLLGGKNVLENKAAAEATNPINYVSDAKDVPPILMMHGSKDRIVPFKQSAMMADALNKKGLTYQFYQMKGADHGSFDFWTKESFDIVDGFLRKYTIRR